MKRVTNIGIVAGYDNCNFKKYVDKTLRNYVVSDAKISSVDDTDFIVYFVKPTIKIVDAVDPCLVMDKLDSSARVCYCSDKPTSEDYNYNVVTNCIKNGHTSILEHVSFTFDITTNRAVLAELTRHRIASYSVESTRYCAYENKGFKFLVPLKFEDYVSEDDPSDTYNQFINYCMDSAKAYMSMINNGCTHDDARRALNQDLAVNIRCTFNIRSLRNFLNLRYSNNAHIDIREIAAAIYDIMYTHFPWLVEDINPTVSIKRRVPVKYDLITSKPDDEVRIITHTGNSVYNELPKYDNENDEWDFADGCDYICFTKTDKQTDDIPLDYFDRVNDTLTSDSEVMNAFTEYTSDIVYEGDNE